MVSYFFLPVVSDESMKGVGHGNPANQAAAIGQPSWQELRNNSVADPGCLSRIPDPDLPIPDPKKATKERGEKKFVGISFFVATSFTKLKII